MLGEATPRRGEREGCGRGAGRAIALPRPQSLFGEAPQGLVNRFKTGRERLREPGARMGRESVRSVGEAKARAFEPRANHEAGGVRGALEPRALGIGICTKPESQPDCKPES